MYLNNILFISEETLKNESLINLNTDNRLLTSAIKSAQMENILPIIGSDLFVQIQNQISGNTVSSANQTLLESYIQPALIYYSAAKAIPFIHFQLRNGGVNKLVGDTIQPAELNEIDYLVNSLTNTAEFHAKRLIDYLKANESVYPLFMSPTSNKDTIQPNKSNVYSTGMYIPKS